MVGKKNAATVEVEESLPIGKHLAELLARVGIGWVIGYILAGQLEQENLLAGMVLMAVVFVFMWLNIKLPSLSFTTHITGTLLAAAALLFGFILGSPFV